jgi:hypothetical protein
MHTQSPRIHVVDDARQDQAPDEGRDARSADQQARPCPPHQGFRQGDVVSDEADLDGEAQGKGDRRAPQEQAAICRRGDRRQSELRRGIALRDLAIAQQAEIGGTAVAQHDRDQGAQDQDGRDGGHDQTAPEAEFTDRQQQQRHARDGTDAGAHDGQGHRASLVTLEPRGHRGGDARHRERGPAEAQQDEAGIKLPRRGHLADQRHARRHAGEPQEQHGARSPAGSMARPTKRWTLALTRKNSVMADATSAIGQPCVEVTACR